MARRKSIGDIEKIQDLLIERHQIEHETVGQGVEMTAAEAARHYEIGAELYDLGHRSRW